MTKKHWAAVAIIALLLWLLWRGMKSKQSVSHKILGLGDPVKAIAYGPAIHQFVDGRWYWSAPQGYHVETAGDGSFWVVETTPTRTGPQMVVDSGATWVSAGQEGSVGGIGSSDILPQGTINAAFQGNITGFSGPYRSVGTLPGITMTPQDTAVDTADNPDPIAPVTVMPVRPGRGGTYIPGGSWLLN